MTLKEEIERNPERGARRLAAEYGQRLFETARHFCRNDQDAEDLTFRTLSRALSRFDGFDERSSPFSWLYRMLVNLLRTDARRKGANALDFTAEVPDVVDPAPDPAETLAAFEDVTAVRAAVDALSPPLRAVVVFRYFEDLTVPEIARILAVPEGTVKSRLHLAKIALRRNLERTIRPELSSNPTERSFHT